MTRFAPTLAVLAALFMMFGCNKEESSSSTTSPASQPARKTAPGSSGRAGGKTLVVIPKGTTHVFWQTVNAGAQAAGRETGYEVVFKGPLKEDSRNEQIGIVEQFITEGVAGIALAPLDRKGLVDVVAAAKSDHIPVVIFDSSLEGEAGKDFDAYVATDNYKGGTLAGTELARLLNGKGKVVLLRYAVGSASTEQREAGFVDALKKHPDIQIISDNQYAGATVGEAKARAMNMLDVLKQADGVFSSNESATQGLMSALEDNGLLGKLKFVGFDTSKLLVEAMQGGKIDALVSQDPRNMGYTAVKTLVARIEGKTVEPTVDTGVYLVTKEKLGDPAIQKVLGSQLK
jgi:ribose transport system substrate-binding protein